MLSSSSRTLRFHCKDEGASPLANIMNFFRLMNLIIFIFICVILLFLWLLGYLDNTTIVLKHNLFMFLSPEALIFLFFGLIFILNKFFEKLKSKYAKYSWLFGFVQLFTTGTPISIILNIIYKFLTFTGVKNGYLTPIAYDSTLFTIKATLNPNLVINTLLNNWTFLDTEVKIRLINKQELLKLAYIKEDFTQTTEIINNCLNPSYYDIVWVTLKSTIFNNVFNSTTDLNINLNLTITFSLVGFITAYYYFLYFQEYLPQDTFKIIHDLLEMWNKPVPLCNTNMPKTSDNLDLLSKLFKWLFES